MAEPIAAQVQNGEFQHYRERGVRQCSGWGGKAAAQRLGGSGSALSSVV
jgi:hypothetical protein